MVRPMISRVRAGGLAVVFCVSVVLVPGDTFARGGGFGSRGFTGRSAFGFHSPASRSHAQLHAPGFDVPLRRHFGWGFIPQIGFGDGYYPGFGSPEYAVPSDRPVEVEREITGAIPTPGPIRQILVPLFPLRPGCPTQTVTVTAKDGDEHTIDIMRC
jgi:hypothetical protein